MNIGEAAAEKKLYDAATVGDVATFHQLIQQHPHFLHVVSFPCLRNALHIAITEGHINIVEEVLKIKPQLARDVDFTKSSSLHIAAAQGSVEIVEKLLAVAPEMCWLRDDQGMNPVHIAAMKGRVEILEELLRLDLFPALERVHRGQTVLHLCVKHRQLRALIVLAEKLVGLARASDDDGETLLHMAVRSNQIEMVRYLVGRNKIEDITKNSMGISPWYVLNGDANPPPGTSTKLEISSLLGSLNDKSVQDDDLKASKTTMVVAILIATMAFQAAVSPPGGVWQDDTSSHSAGKAVVASTHPKIYKHFVRASTTAFVSSLITIFLTAMGLTNDSKFRMVMVIYAMWVSMASIGVSYGASLIMTNPLVEIQSIGQIVAIVASFFIGIFLLVGFYVIPFEWKKGRSQENLTTDDLIARSSHRNSQWNEKASPHVKFFKPRFWKMTDSPPSRDTAVVP